MSWCFQIIIGDSNLDFNLASLLLWFIALIVFRQ